MADIQQLTYPFFTDGTTPLNASNLNQIVAKINELVVKVNGGVTPTQTVATPVISISGTTATISCSTSGATIYYTLNGNTPTTSSTQYSSPITLSGACTIKAIAVKSGMNNSSVASQSYTPSASYDSDAQAIMNRYTKSLSTAKKDAFNTFIVNLKNGGIYSKIKCLIIPVLANNVTEATQNALTGNSAFSEGGATLALDNNGGIKPVVGASLAKIASTSFSGVSSQNFHLSFFNITSSDDTEYWDVAMNMASYNILTFGLAYSTTLGLGSTFKDANDSNVGLGVPFVNKSNAKVHAIVSFDTSESRLTYNKDGEPTNWSKTNVLAENLTAGDITFGQYNGGTTYNTTEQDSKSKMMTRATYGLFTIGTSLSQTEAENFNSYVCSFMDSFLD